MFDKYYIKFDWNNIFHTTVDLEIDDEDNLTTFGFVCSTVYLSPQHLMIVVATNNTTIHSQENTCPGQAEVSMTLDSNNDLCGAPITVCGYWVLLNGSTLLDCPLNCISSVTRECATNPTRSLPQG